MFQGYKGCKVCLPKVILLSWYKEPQPSKSQKVPRHHMPQTQSIENSNPKNPSQDPNQKPQTHDHNNWGSPRIFMKIED